MLHQQRNVFPPLPQRRHSNRKHVQPVVQIAAKLLLAHLIHQFAIGRRNQTKIHFQRLNSAQPLEFRILQNPQQFRLQLQRDLSYLIQEERALVRQFEPANLPAHRPGEGAFLIAKQLAFQQARRNRRTIHFDEALVRALAQPVDRPRHQLLPRSRFAQQQHGGIGPSHGCHIFHHSLQGPAAPDDLPVPQFGVDFLLEVELFLGELPFGFPQGFARLAQRGNVHAGARQSDHCPRGIKSRFDRGVEIVLPSGVGDLYLLAHSHPALEHPSPDLRDRAPFLRSPELAQILSQHVTGRARKGRVVYPRVAQLPVLAEHRNRRMFQCHSEPFFALPQGRFRLLASRDIEIHAQRPYRASGLILENPPTPRDPMHRAVGPHHAPFALHGAVLQGLFE